MPLLPDFLALAALLLLAAITWNRIHTRGTATFFVLVLVQLTNGAVFLMEQSVLSLDLKLFFDNLQFIGHSAIYVTALRLASELSGFKPASVIANALFFTLVFVFVFITDQNIFPGLDLRSGVRIIDMSGYTRLTYIPGNAFIVWSVSQGVIAVMSLGILIRELVVRSDAHRESVFFYLSGLFVILAGPGLYFFDIPYFSGRDQSLAFFVVGNFILFWGLFRHRISDLLPAARSRMFELISDAVLVADSSGIIVDANKSANTLFTRVGLIGARLHQIRDFPADIRDAFVNSREESGTCTLNLPDTGDRHLKWTLQRLTIGIRNTGQVGWLLVLHDETDSLHFRELSTERQQQLEAEIRTRNEQLAIANEWLRTEVRNHEKTEAELALARDAAEAASRAKSVFVANVSHEIRTPLNGILGIAEILLDSDLPEKEKSYLVSLRDSAISLLAIINDILDFEKIAAGKMTIHSIPVNLDEILRRASDTFQARCTQKGVRLSWSRSKDVPDTIMSDPVRLRQILLNLLSNAVKFTDEGSIEVTAQREGSDLLISVRDTGIGIPADKQATVFESFEQVDGTSTRRFGGTGLGLPIVRQLSRLLGGDITMQSVPDAGSEFRVRIPFRQSKPEASVRYRPAPEMNIPVLKPGRILIAEDNDVNRLILGSMLRKIGAEVTEARNGREAVELSQSANPEFIFMDIQMPEMDGVTAAGIIRQKSRNKIPIVAVSANAMPGDRDKILHLGFDDYLVKPYNRMDVVMTLDRHAPHHWKKTNPG